MKKLSLILSIPLLLFFSCDEQQAEKDFFNLHAELIKEIAEEFELSLEETALIEPEGLAITFTDVTEDSRCPLNVHCVWAGRVSVQLEVLHKNRELAIQLTLGDDQDSSTDEIDGIQIILLEVTPYPEHPEIIDVEDYAIKLVVNKL